MRERADGADGGAVARWRKATTALMAGLVWLAAYFLYPLGLALWKGAGAPRALGTGFVGVACLAAACAVAAAAFVAWGLDRRPRLMAILGDAFFALAAASLALLGLAIFYRTAGASPPAAKAFALAFPIALFLAYRRNPPPYRAQARRAMRAIALVALAIPVAALPLVAYAAAIDQPRLPTAVDPPTGRVRPDAPGASSSSPSTGSGPRRAGSTGAPGSRRASRPSRARPTATRA